MNPSTILGNVRSRLRVLAGWAFSSRRDVASGKVLPDIVATIRSGLFKIAFAKDGAIVGAGSAFLVNDFLITNNHVYSSHLTADQVGIRREDMAPDQYQIFSAEQFRSRLVTGSDEGSYDYAVVRVPEVIRNTDHRFRLEAPGTRRIGDPVALLGFPLEHDNLTCHQGIVSSFYKSGLASVIQIDASVNAGNSGGPLIDPTSGAAFGIVTRKATGLSNLFKELRESVNGNIAFTQGISGGISIGGLNVVEAFKVSQNQMLRTLGEIERQANVGIGYAFSAEHLLAENAFPGRCNLWAGRS